MNLAEQYRNRELQLICDYLVKACEVSERELAKVISANRPRSTQKHSTPPQGSD